MKRLISTILVIIGSMGLSATACAAVITITFDNVPADIECGEVWYEHGIAMWFTNAVAGECGEGQCSFGVEKQGVVWLYPSSLAIDLSNLAGIISIEADYIDGCPHSWCENAFLFNGGNVVDEDHSDNNPLVIESGGSPVDLLRINGCEDGFTEIRIIGDGLVATQASTWGRLKAIYR